MLVPRLAESLWSRWQLLVSVEARTWHFKLQRLAVENLIVIEPRRGGIETDFFASHRLVVPSSLLVRPDFMQLVILQASYLIFYAENGILFVDVFALIALADDLLPGSALGGQNSYAWVFGRVAAVKPVEL